MSAAARPEQSRARNPLRNRLEAKRNGLPRPTAWRVEPVRIPLRDGVELGADLYVPTVPSLGLVLSRSPYGRHGLMLAAGGTWLASQGYTVLLVSTRGTADSGGEFDPMRDEVRDGEDVLQWMRAQPWYPGRFATIGHSYLGYTQWALQSLAPDDLAASIVLMGPHDFSHHFWGSGTFYNDLLGWAELSTQVQKSVFAAIVGLARSDARLAPVRRATPVLDAADAYFRTTASWLHDRLTRPELSDPFWAPMQHRAVLDTTTVPTLIVAGWYDIFLGQSMTQFAHLHARGVPTTLICGPWTHTGGSMHQVADRQTLEWLDVHLRRAAPAFSRPAVQVQDAATAVWHSFETWPPRETHELTFYLHPEEGLTAERPQGAEAEVSFRFDPADPTPTIGGNHLNGGGRKNDTALAHRSDTVHFDTQTLTRAVTITGAPVVQLTHAVELPDADLFVRVSDVDERGRSHNVSDGYLRTRGGQVELRLADTAYTVSAGHRLRLLIAGGSFPAYTINPGTGENPLTATVRHANLHRIVCGPDSRLTLPVLAQP